MKTSDYSFCRILAVTSALWVLAAGQTAPAQTSPLSISPPNDTASITIQTSPAWWINYDFSQADNASFLYANLGSDTAGIPPGAYLGWCIDTLDGINPLSETYSATLYSTCDANIDADLPAAYPASVYVSLPVWHQINYLLNHKNGAYWYDIQIAIWELMGETIPGYELAGEGLTTNSSGKVYYANGFPNINWSEVTALTNAAVANAAGWSFQCGNVIAVVVAVHPNSGDQAYQLNSQDTNDQLTIIEYPYSAASVSGNVFLDCTGATPSVGANSPLTGLVVSLLNASSVPVASATTDVNGYYTFTNLPAGTYFVQVTPPANYSETFPNAGGGNQAQITVGACSNSVENFGYADHSPVSLSVPSGGNLGANPAIIPTDQSVQAGSKASDDRGSLPVSASHTVSKTGVCQTMYTFTVTAAGTCDQKTATVNYFWTTDTTPPTIIGVPAGGNLKCNPVVPTVASVSNLVSATDTCSTPTISVTSADSVSGCVTTRTFTITATDGAGNHSSTNVVYTWTTDTTGPMITNVPAGGNLGTNPVVPTVASVSNLVHATDTCSTPTISVTSADSVNGCVTTRTFTITATDGCGNHSSTNTVYTWTANTGPTVSCPANLTIATNFTPIYCTFSPSDWCGSCNGSNTFPSWWTSWDQKNGGYNCFASWTNWWTSCTGNNPGSNCWNFCRNQNSGNNGNQWWGGSCNQNTAPNWCSSWNNGNPNANWWVPCNGNNPGSVLTNCFGQIYSNGCVKVGKADGYCVSFTSSSAVRQCLGFSGTAGTLNCSAVNPSSCNAGSFCAQVLALQLNCDFGDAGASSGFGGPCGDLVLNDSTSPCNGQKVRDILKTANCVLGGGSAPSGCSASYLCGLCSNLNQCFEGCQVSSWCKSHLVPVYVPPPSVSGTATATGSACAGTPVLTYRDSIAAGACSGSYVITRTWTAVDSTGASNYCSQLITITSSPGPSISGTIVNDCAGAGCASGGNNGGWGYGGWNYGGWGSYNSTPNFSGDAGLAGVTVTLKNSSGVVLTATTTDTNGNFTFANPGAGTYTVVVTPPAGYSLTYPTSGTSNQTSVTISNACQTVCNLLFAYMGNQTGVLLIKTGPASVACGQTITYKFAVTNTGNNCIALSVLDPQLGGQVFSQNSVAPGQGFTFTHTYTTGGSDIGKLTNTAWAVADPPVGPNVTNSSSVVTTVTTKPVTCSITCSPGSISPTGYLWCNARLGATPNCAANLYCQNATVTLNCSGGKSYTYSVPDSQICFSKGANSASCAYNGSTWCSTVPSGGDNEIFLAGCGIAPNANFAHCQSITWTGTFSSDTAGLGFNWQFGSSSYTTDCSQYGSLGVKSCYNAPCSNVPGNCAGDHAGTPENCKSGCTGKGGNSCYINSCGNSGSSNCKLNPCY